MGAELAWAQRRIRKQQEAILGGADRFVDMGIVLRTVRQDMEHGRRLIDGRPPLVVLDERRFGGMVDARTQEFCGPSRNPVVWHVSEDQARLILHDSPLPDRLLVYGSEGGGKTVTLAYWLALRALEFTGSSPAREIGVTAPTTPRLKNVHKTITDWWPASWMRWIDRDSVFVMRNGVTVRLISTHVASAKDGSRIQGYNWSAAASDELQDSTEEDPSIESRLRSAPEGRGKRIATATAKDHSDWRTWRDAALGDGGLWKRFDLLAARSPFIWPNFLEEKRRTMSLREFNRRYGAQDVPPERLVYPSWSRKENVRRRPTVEHAAGRVLDRTGGPFGMLIGHDPGKKYRYSVFLLPWLAQDNRPRWWVVDEVWNDSGTVEDHVLAVLRRLREKWGCHLLDRNGRPSQESPRALVRTDIYTDNGHDDRHPDRSVYTQFRKYGVTILPAAMKPGPNGQIVKQQIPKNARIDMINTLLQDASRERRLFVDCDEAGRPVAPKLVDAIESMERDEDGNAETARKGDGDKSHFTAGLGYALWALEKVRMTDPKHGAE